MRTRPRVAFRIRSFNTIKGQLGCCARLLRSVCLMKMRHAATHRHHAGRLRRDRAGDCRSRAEIRSHCRNRPDTRSSANIPIASRDSPTAETARAAAAALEEAVTLARRGELDAIVTGPIHKARMYRSGFQVSRTDGIFCRALRRQKFRNVSYWRKNYGRTRHSASSTAQGRDRAQAIRGCPSRSVACGFPPTASVFAREAPCKLDGFKPSSSRLKRPMLIAMA